MKSLRVGLYICMLFRLSIQTVTISSTSFTSGSQLPSKYGSTVATNGVIKTTGQLPNFVMSGATLSTTSSPNYYNIFCYQGQYYLWGTQNIKVISTDQVLQLQSGTWLNTTFISYHLPNNTYLGPNNQMFIKQSTYLIITRFTVALYSSTTQNTGNTISSLYTQFSGASPSSKNTITFLYQFSDIIISTLMLLSILL